MKLRSLAGQPVATCSIVAGELLYGAELSQARDQNVDGVKAFLRTIDVFELTESTAEEYGALKAALRNRYGSPGRRQSTETLGFKENDLWIAAVAIEHGLTVITTDSDFSRIAEVVELKVDRWMPEPA